MDIVFERTCPEDRGDDNVMEVKNCLATPTAVRDPRA